MTSNLRHFRNLSVDDTNLLTSSYWLAYLYHMGRCLHLLRCPSYEIPPFLDVLFPIRLGNGNDSHGLMTFPLSRSFVFRRGLNRRWLVALSGFIQGRHVDLFENGLLSWGTRFIVLFG